MSHPIRNVIMLSATALALIAAPVLMNQTVVSDLQAIAKDKGGGGGGEGGGGGGGGGGSEHGNAGGNGGGNGGGGGNGHGASGESKKSESQGKKVAATEELTTTTKAAKATKTKNLNAQLAGLNSLKRNINGLMNSSDPRMEQIRAYIEASAELEAATAELTEAEGLLGELQAALGTYLDTATTDLVAFDGSTVYDAPTLQGLTDRVGELDAAIELDPLNQAAIDERTALLAALETIEASPELAAVTEQQGVVDGLAEEIAGLEELTTEEALQEALLAAANKNRVAEAGEDAYLTPEIMAWATARIEALTDQYQAQQ